MEIVRHLINDTIEFYRWTLTIAGKEVETSATPASESCSCPLKLVFIASVGGFALNESVANVETTVMQTSGWRNGL